MTRPGSLTFSHGYSFVGRGVLMCVAAVALMACPATMQPRPEDGPATVEDVVARLDAYLATGPVAAVIGARASQYSDDGALKGKVEFLVDRRAGFRMSGLTPTDDVISTIACSTERFSAFERGARTCYTGPACSNNVARFATIPMAPAELAGVLLGRPPLLGEGATPTAFDWDGEAGAWMLTVRDPAGFREQTIWLTETNPRIVRTRVITAGRLSADVRYSEFKRLDGASIPHRIDIRLARGDTDLRIDIRELDTTTGFEASAFVLECPQGAVVETLPCE
jgi:hypothetical protein